MRIGLHFRQRSIFQSCFGLSSRARSATVPLTSSSKLTRFVQHLRTAHPQKASKSSIRRPMCLAESQMVVQIMIAFLVQGRAGARRCRVIACITPGVRPFELAAKRISEPILNLSSRTARSVSEHKITPWRAGKVSDDEIGLADRFI